MNTGGHDITNPNKALLLMEEIWLTSWYGKYPMFHKVSQITGRAGFFGFVCGQVMIDYFFAKNSRRPCHRLSSYIEYILQQIMKWIFPNIYIHVLPLKNKTDPFCTLSPLILLSNLQARAQQYEEAWERSIEKVKQIGGTCVEVDYAPFQEAAGGEMDWDLSWILLGFLLGPLLGSFPPKGRWKVRECYPKWPKHSGWGFIINCPDQWSLFAFYWPPENEAGSPKIHPILKRKIIWTEPSFFAFRMLVFRGV